MIPVALWRNYLFPIPPCNGPLGHVRRSTGNRLELTPACRPSDPQNGVPKPPIWRSQTPDLGCEVLVWVPFGTHLRLLVRCIRIVGPPENRRSPSYPGGPSTGPIALAGSAVFFTAGRALPSGSGTLFGTYLGSQIMIRRTRFRGRDQMDGGPDFVMEYCCLWPLGPPTAIPRLMGPWVIWGPKNGHFWVRF